MSREKQIDEMALIIGGSEIYEHEDYLEAKQKAKEIYNKGYRKQIEGEWILEHETYGRNLCSKCGEEALKEYSWNDVLKGHLKYVRSNFCPNCGAKMKGGAE